jgi:hypothetical protein
MPTRRRNTCTGMHGRSRLNLRSSALPMIAKTFVIAKTFRSYRANFLRHAKSLRDHGDAPRRPV